MRFFLWVSLLSMGPVAASAQSDFARQILVKNQPGTKRPARKPASENKDGSKVQIPAAEPALIQAPASAPAQPEEPKVVDQVKTLFSEDDSAMKFFEERLDPDDPRLNRLEIEGRAGFTSVNSASSYSYREYKSSFAAMDLRSNVWLVPGFGLTGSLRFSMGGSVRGDTATGSMDRVRDEEMVLGMLFRRHFGLTRLSPSLEFGALYMDHSFNVATESVDRARWNSKGVGVALESRLPSSNEHAWIVGGRLFPRLLHRESKTSIEVESGTPAENIRLDLFAGGELSFGRGHQFLYSVEATAERDQFDGPASLPDPKTSATPSNVTVTNSTVNFSFGYRWGR